MNKNRRILYISHDNPFPSGGVKVINHHVSHLVKNGLPAFVVHNKPDFNPPWLVNRVPTLYFEKDLRIYPDDIVVIPEDHNAALEALRDVHILKYIFCQNHFYCFKGLNGKKGWEDYGVSGVFCCSEVISDFISSVFDYDRVPVIHNAIPMEIFKPCDKKLQIAYMPRKRPAEIEFIKNLFTKLTGCENRFSWVGIDGMAEAEVALVLGESAIFLSMSMYEGFGLPPIEAMAAGCLVVGFHGYGGREYAAEHNGFWCKEGDIIECAWKLHETTAMITAGDKRIEFVKQQALKTAENYSMERQEKELMGFWKDNMIPH